MTVGGGGGGRGMVFVGKLSTVSWRGEGYIASDDDNRQILYNWLIWRVLKLAFFFQKSIFPVFIVWSSQNNAIFM